MNEQEAALLLSQIPRLQPLAVGAIARRFGSFSRYFSQDPSALPPSLAEPCNYFARHRARLERETAAQLAVLAERDIQLLPFTATTYPQLLREIHDPPPLLYVKGNVTALALPQVAIVGSRRASRWGVQQAESFAGALADGGFTITSGLALGVDGAAHRGALRRGTTIAVLGCGVDRVYPRQHRRLYEEILAGDGAIVSELPPGAPPLRHHFPLRNRIISGLSLGILIVEAAARSGSLITARLALEQGREVFAIPGSIHNPLARGCHQLIREGAVLTETLDDMVGHLGGLLSLKAEETPSPAREETPVNPLERRVLAAMEFEPIDADSLQARLGVAVGELTAALVNLEIQGFIEGSGGVYQRLK